MSVHLYSRILYNLNLKDDEEISVKLTALLIGSLHSENGNKYTLSEISRSIAGAGLSAKLVCLYISAKSVAN